MFALIPSLQIGVATLVVGALGIAFVLASLLSLRRIGGLHGSTLRDAALLVGLATTFTIQLIRGIELISDPLRTGPLATIAILVVVCFVLGIYRAWDLVGGPLIGIGHEIGARIKGRPGNPERKPGTRADP